MNNIYPYNKNKYSQPTRLFWGSNILQNYHNIQSTAKTIYPAYLAYTMRGANKRMRTDTLGDFNGEKINISNRGQGAMGTCPTTERVNTKIMITNGHLQAIGGAGSKIMRICRNGKWHPAPKDNRSMLLKAMLPQLSSQQQEIPYTFSSGRDGNSDSEQGITVHMDQWLTLEHIKSALAEYARCNVTRYNQIQGQTTATPGEGFATSNGQGNDGGSTDQVITSGNAFNNNPYSVNAITGDQEWKVMQEPTIITSTDSTIAGDKYSNAYTMLKNMQKKYRFRNPLNTRCKFTMYEFEAKEDCAADCMVNMGEYYQQLSMYSRARYNMDVPVGSSYQVNDYQSNDIPVPFKYDEAAAIANNPPTTVYKIYGSPYHRNRAMKKIGKQWKTLNKVTTTLEPGAVFEYVSSFQNFKWYESKEWELLNKINVSGNISGGGQEELHGTNIIGGVTRTFMMFLEGPNVYSVNGIQNDDIWNGTVPYTTMGYAKIDVLSESCWCVLGSFKQNKQHVIKNRILEVDPALGTVTDVEKYPRKISVADQGTLITETATLETTQPGPI